MSFTKKEYKTVVVFDFDGTLINTYRRFKKLFDLIFKKYGTCNLNSEDIHKLYGMTSLEIIKYLFLKNKIRFSGFLFYLTNLKRLIRYGYKNAKIYKEVPDCLKRLNNHFLIVISNASQKRITQILQDNHVLSYFDLVLGREFLQAGKPDPAMLYKMMDRLNVDSNKVIVIDDSVSGIVAANRANLKSIAVLYTTPESLLRKYSNPNLIIHNLSELTDEVINQVMLTQPID
jgi:HAD superfamily hydrolase (TIGR01509 family)